MWKTKLAKSRTVRSAAQPIAASVGSAPTSNITASENSRASAAAVAELVKGLDFVFDQLDFESMPACPPPRRLCVCLYVYVCMWFWSSRAFWAMQDLVLIWGCGCVCR